MRFDRKTDILLVDDTPANLLVLEAVLGSLSQNLVKANSGADALRYLMDHEVAIILMDVKMPGLDGFETAELIRRRERTRYTPIIFLTGHDHTDLQEFKGYAAGAVDFLTKPFVPDVLKSKVAIFVELFQKTDQVRQQSELLREIERKDYERRMAEAKERWEQERLREEIRLARLIQQKLFPVAPLPSAAFDISGASYPAEATGGDYFDYIPMRDGGLGVVIGDVSGHGFGPALLMAELRAYLRALLLTREDVGEIVALLNRALAEDAPEGHFATLLLARLEPSARSVVYANAGHTPGYVLSPSGEVKSILYATGMPLAVLSDGDFPAVAIPPLEPGELLLLFTDGIVEAHDPDGKLFGMDRLLDVVRTNQGRTARVIVDTMYGAVRAYCGAQTQLDDMTMIIIKAVLPAGTCRGLD
ncbi:MAG TPA: SpoIIE family protein phosphatase [Gemmataceae bacterium]|jgi:serine phosphatase RsbU (regulator of sigma subunit)|nr:SpoIIE family protein phosphatase [Gemmataceae bacterium]